MAKEKQRNTVPYPRRRLARFIARGLGRLVLPLVFRIRINGRRNFPRGGPLIVVGNHVAVMEAVLMTVFTPWQVELLGAADIPHEPLTQFVADFFGFIPVNRGHMDRPALRNALGVLAQDGVVGVFPEGGIWDVGGMRPQTGVAWLSYRSQAPVLPIGFEGTMGAIGGALRLERPRLTMTIGELIPAARVSDAKARKRCFETFAVQVMDAVNGLLSPDAVIHRPSVMDEQFELQVTAHESGGREEPPPANLVIRHATALAKFLHRPAILKIFRINLNLPIEPLQNLARVRDAGVIGRAIQSVLSYLEMENPYLLTYRFGPKEAEAMEAGLRELLALTHWASASGLTLTVVPIRRYYSLEEQRQIEQIEQGVFEDWM